ncbi:MAG TPA: hypothetical protein VJA84_02325, partial [Candidatus Omnitrophota bacterium]|nr:hypothetical protein [Candidatus Omnitrophota bacterium]
MLKKIVFALAFVAAALGAAILSGPALADEPPPCPPECLTDTLEIVTWYPSPYSEYEELRLYPKWTYSPCDDNSRGLIYYDNNNTPQDSDDKLMVCRGAELGWREAGYWKLADSGTDDISYALNGNVGIGTVSPSAKLDVAGGVKIGSDSGVCDSTKGGTIRYNNADGCLEYCDGVNLAWSSVDSSCPFIPITCVSGSQDFLTPGVYSLDIDDTTKGCKFTFTIKGGGGASSGGPNGGLGGGIIIRNIEIPQTGTHSFGILVGAKG